MHAIRAPTATPMFSTLLFMLATAASQTAAPVERGVVDERVLGKGTPFETPWFERRGSAEGPTVLITGGMHGNEPAGAAAAEEIACWTIGKGKLVVVPRMNRPALAAKQRLIPDTSEPEGNVNRHFPIGGEVTPGVATDLWALFEAVEPDWVLDLHEGFAFRRLNSGSVGSSVIACADERAGELAQQMIAAVDGTIDAAERKFTLIRGPIAGSFARAAWENAGVPSMILETTFGLFPVAEDEERRFSVSSRARQHRLMVHTFLSEIGMEPCSADVLVGAREEESRVRVAIYDDLGAGVSGSAAMERVLAAYEDVVTRRVGSADVCAGALAQFDVVLHPGGSGKAQARSLGEVGRAQEIEFVRAGGGFLGVCAGGYLAACNYDWSLGVLDARTIDTASGHWRRGRAELEIELSPAGMSLFDEVDASVDIQYANGPIFAPGEREEIPDYEVLALYRGEVALNGTSTGIMPGTPACIRGAFGNGRAIAFSPHPEKSPALEHFVRDAVLWAAGECDRTVSDTNQSVSPELRAAGAERR